MIYITTSIPNGCVHLFIYLFGVLRRFQHCTGHITTGSWKGRGNQYIQFVRVLYCKLPTDSKQLPAFPLEAVPRIEPRPQRWEARVLPLCHRGPSNGCVQYWQTQLPCTQGSEIYVPNGSTPKINIIVGVPSGCAHKTYITASIRSSSVLQQRYQSSIPSDCEHMIYFSVSVPNNSNLFLQHTQFFMNQVSKQLVLNACALDISTFYSILNWSVHKAL